MATKKSTTKQKTVKKAPAKAKVPTTSDVAKPKAAAKKAAVKKPAAKKVAAPSKAAAKTTTPTPEERYRMVEQAAYYIAERAGFEGDPQQFWVKAEQEIEARLSSK